MAKTSENEIQTRVTNIKTVYFSLNPEQRKSEDYDYHFSFQDFFEIDSNRLRILVTAVIRSGEEADSEQENATIKVLNDYHIDDISQFIVNNKLTLPEDLNKIFLSISYSHVRALLANHLTGTYLASVLPPIIPIDLIYQAKKRSLGNK